MTKRQPSRARVRRSDPNNNKTKTKRMTRRQLSRAERSAVRGAYVVRSRAVRRSERRSRRRARTRSSGGGSMKSRRVLKSGRVLRYRAAEEGASPPPLKLVINGNPLLLSSVDNYDHTALNAACKARGIFPFSKM